MKTRITTSVGVLVLLGLASASYAQLGVGGLRSPNKMREIALFDDRAQDYMTTRVYELKHTIAADLRPFVEGAVRRADGESTVARLAYKHGKTQFLSVSMPNWMVPHIDDMVAKLDRPGVKDDEGSVISGTGIYRFYYAPKHRSTQEMIDFVSGRFDGGDDIQFRDPGSNIFYWKGSASDGKDVGKWIQAIDRPVPQMEININVYEITDSALRELGIDFVAWKNGPGADLFHTGFDYLDFGSLTDDSNFLQSLDISALASHSWGGFMIAPNIDATFLRMLAQKGKAKVASSGYLTVVNGYNNATLNFQPEFQAITKDNNQEIDVVDTAYQVEFELDDPVINFNNDQTAAAILNARWNLEIDNSMVEQTFDGSRIVNEYNFSSRMTLAAGTEKLLGYYAKEHKVNQDNGIIGLGEIPGLKYIFGSEADAKNKTHVYVTVSANPVRPDTDLSPWAGKMIASGEEMLQK